MASIFFIYNIILNGMEQHWEKNGVSLWDFLHILLVSDPQTELHVPIATHPGKQGLKQDTGLIGIATFP